MLTLESVITRLKTEATSSSYTIEQSRIKEPVLSDMATFPIIYVGYHSIDSKNPTSPVEHDLFNNHGEDLVQTFEIQIVSEVANFSPVWKNVYKSLIGWHPTEAGILHTGFTYSQGGVMGLENSRLWWLDRWKVGFPTVYIDL